MPPSPLGGAELGRRRGQPGCGPARAKPPAASGCPHGRGTSGSRQARNTGGQAGRVCSWPQGVFNCLNWIQSIPGREFNLDPRAPVTEKTMLSAAPPQVRDWDQGGQGEGWGPHSQGDVGRVIA